MIGRARLAVLLAVVLTASGCFSGDVDTGPFEGFWQSEGYGLYLDVSGGIDVYEHTSVSCALVAGGSGRDLGDLFSLEGERLILTEGTRRISFDHIDSLPDRCSERFRSTDPADVLTVVVATMAEHYAFLDLREPGWVARAEALAGRVSPEASDSELLVVMREMLGPLADGQVRIAGPGPDLIPSGAWSAGEVPADVAALAGRIADGEVPGLGDVEIAAEGAVVSGLLSGGMGYVAITRLAGFADGLEAEERVLAAALDNALLRLAGAPGLVLDLRANRGGRENLALLVASRFVADDTLVATREVRIGGTDTYADGGELVARPLPTGPFEAPVAVLVGPGTGGAAEMLALALREARTPLVGEPTAGSLSPLLIRLLPNGWTLGLSHQRVFDADGTLWEAVGIPVDVTVEEETTADRDPVIEAGVGSVG